MYIPQSSVSTSKLQLSSLQMSLSFSKIKRALQKCSLSEPHTRNLLVLQEHLFSQMKQGWSELIFVWLSVLMIILNPDLHQKNLPDLKICITKISIKLKGFTLDTSINKYEESIPTFPSNVKVTTHMLKVKWLAPLFKSQFVYTLSVAIQASQQMLTFSCCLLVDLNLCTY